MASWGVHHARDPKQSFAAKLSHLEDIFNENGEHLATDFAVGGLGTRVRIHKDCSGFIVEVHPWRDLWIRSKVIFDVLLPEGFPKARPQARWTHCDEEILNDLRLRNAETGEPRLSPDGRVISNLFESRYMGWLETYELEVVVHTLRRLFFRTEDDLAPSTLWYKRSDPFPIMVESTVYEEQGPRKEMEDRVCLDDGRFVGPSAAISHEFGAIPSGMPPPSAPASPKKNAKISNTLGNTNAEKVQHSVNTMMSGTSNNSQIAAYNSINTTPIETTASGNSSSTGSSSNGKLEVPHLTGFLSNGAEVIPGEQHALLEDSSDDGSDSSGPVPNILSNLGVEVIHDKVINSIFQGSKTTPHRNVHHLDLPPHTLKGRKVSLHAVFDGHGGEEAAEEASKLLPTYFYGELDNPSMSIRRALYNAVISVETSLAARAEEERENKGYVKTTSGTTVCAIAIDLNQGVLHCANVGDSRAVLCRNNGLAYDLSYDHKATLPAEVARIVDTGGFVSYGRVMGMLAVSRALGDPEMKVPYALVSSVPSMTSTELESSDEFVLIACDGVYDVMSSQEAVHFVRGVLPAAEHNLDNAAISLVRNCIVSLGSLDNVSVILIRLGVARAIRHNSVGSGRHASSSLSQLFHGEADSYTTGDSGMDHLHLQPFNDEDSGSEDSSDLGSEPPVVHRESSPANTNDKNLSGTAVSPNATDVSVADLLLISTQKESSSSSSNSSISSVASNASASSAESNGEQNKGEQGGLPYLSPQVKAAVRASRLRKTVSGDP
mmetsp:Transcript_18096/g.31523  ORF Transcript_18096/g.31523 Transcript_18096/m.31523 type:complete len:776 (+) Transcript_18096:217-2544(+)|eukprot:CAMPEP_0171486798 /NCGR_PEP_ID=MMETSP0958-20121227/1284_1 /TAXON_ID=87120 /ORGANISM="Aurantiochytrium limacinum, Strain ATCCMYA-1381" /LENGTH=775 /DNA_ID=CAMNT_0012019705 /DNA_START=667 /DNA_END=2994 /DNA_ORIENTATION=-